MNKIFLRHLTVFLLALLATGCIVAFAILGYETYPTINPDIPLPASQRSMLEMWMEVPGPVLLGRAQSGSFLAAMPLAFADPTVVLILPEEPAAADLLRLLRPSVRIPAEALLRQTLAELFGDELSPAYDLLPLLGKGTTLQIARGGGESSVFLLNGSMEDPQALDARLSRLQGLFADARPLVEQRQRTFDDGWTFHDVRVNPAAVERTERMLGGWRVQTTSHPESGKAMLSARDGNRYILTNDPAAFEAYAASTHGSLSLPFHGGSFLAGGFVDLGAMRPLVEILAPDETGVPSMQGAFRWSLVRENEKMIVTTGQ